MFWAIKSPIHWTTFVWRRGTHGRMPCGEQHQQTFGGAASLRHPVQVIEIRRAQPADDVTLGQLDIATWTDDVSPAPAPPAGTPFFNERTKPGDVLVAEVDGAVVGYAKLGPSTRLPSREHVLDLNGLTVDPNRRRIGAGRMLVDAAVEEARNRGARKLSLRVLAGNTGARALYEACGFVVEGVLREEFLLEGGYADDVFMARHLVDTEPVPTAEGTGSEGAITMVRPQRPLA